MREADLRRSDFDYELPPELIAQAPLAARSDSRMLHLGRGQGCDQSSNRHGGDALADHCVRELPALLRAGDLLVFNDTRVLPARLYGAKDSGGRVEVFIERLLGECHALAQVRASRPPRAGTRIVIEGGHALRVMARTDEGFYRIESEEGHPLADILRARGHMPLPPYIARADEGLDRERYQTVFAAREGAVAAPTAGLHFDAPLLDALAAAGIASATVTLHVGAGTFQPVREEDLALHRMHSEWLEVPASTCERIAQTRACGGRVVAVGTTVVRALESAALQGGLRPCSGETAIFITPGHRFRAVDALLTNFHMPCTTLLMLVCAFAGTERVLAAYRHAVRERYRFFSYGDAMLVEP